jgi:hypothetical protein
MRSRWKRAGIYLNFFLNSADLVQVQVICNLLLIMKCRIGLIKQIKRHLHENLSSKWISISLSEKTDGNIIFVWKLFLVGFHVVI